MAKYLVCLFCNISEDVPQTDPQSIADGKL
jgi:hypothetical protein